MAEKVAKLKEENTKLKEEIRRLHRALRDISKDRSISSSPVGTLTPKHQHKSFSNHSPKDNRHSLRLQIAQNLEKGIFSPPKKTRGLSKPTRNKSKEKTLNLVISKESTQPIEFVPSFGEVKNTMSPLATHILSDTLSPKQLAAYNEGGISRALVQDSDLEYSRPKESSSKRNSKRTLHDEIEDLKLSMARINSVLEQKETMLLNQPKKDIPCSFVKNTFESYKENSFPSKHDHSLKDSFGSLYEDIADKQNSTHYEPILRHESPKALQYDSLLMHDTPRNHNMSGTFDSYTKNDTVSRENTLIKEIDALREENKLLRGKFKTLTPTRSRRGRKRTASRKSILKSPVHISKSPSARSTSIRKKSRSITPNRYRHCCTCDHLLSKGYSTKYCTKHGS